MFTTEKLVFVTLADATLEQFLKLVGVVQTLDPDEDGEEPEAYMAWLLTHGLGYNYAVAQGLTRPLLATGNRFLAQSILTESRPKERPPNYFGVHQIHLAFDLEGNLVDIAGVVPDDRDQGALQKLGDTDPEWLGFFGGHNVTRAMRGLGIGTLMVRHRVEVIQHYVDTVWQRPAAFYAFVDNPASAKLLVDVGGFEYLGEWFITYEQSDQHVFRRLFVPNDRPT